jgi:hypothetical protein
MTPEAFNLFLFAPNQMRKRASFCETGESLDAFFARRFNYGCVAEKGYSLKASFTITTSIEGSSIERVDDTVIANETRKVYRVERTI